MKNTLPWHKKCLANSARYHKEQFDSALHRVGIALTMMAEDEFKRAQIVEATRRGKHCFDEDRFMKPARIKAMEEAEQRIAAQICRLKSP